MACKCCVFAASCNLEQQHPELPPRGPTGETIALRHQSPLPRSRAPMLDNSAGRHSNQRHESKPRGCNLAPGVVSSRAARRSDRPTSVLFGRLHQSAHHNLVWARPLRGIVAGTFPEDFASPKRRVVGDDGWQHGAPRTSTLHAGRSMLAASRLRISVKPAMAS